MVTDHTPVASSLVIGYEGLPSISPISSTVFAFGARKRSVTVLSGWPSGETTCTPRPPPPPRPCAGACPAGGVAGAWALPIPAAITAITNESAARFITGSLPVASCRLPAAGGQLPSFVDPCLSVFVRGCQLLFDAIFFATRVPVKGGYRSTGAVTARAGAR